MKLSCTPATLKTPLQTVSKAIATKAPIPILTGILFEARGDKLTMFATDLEQSVKAVLDGVEMLEEGRAVVPKALSGILAKLPAGPVTLTVANYTLSIEYQGGKVNLQTMDPDEFPAMPEVVGEPWTLDFDMRKVAFAAMKDDSRRVFQAVHCNLEEGEFVATDTHRLAIWKGEARPGMGSYNAPAEFLAKVPVGSALRFSSNMVAAEHGEYTYVSRLIDGQFPNYRQVIPQSFATKVKVKRDEVAGCLERADLVSDKVSLRFSGDTLDIAARGETSELKESLACEVAGNELSMWFVARLLLEGLRWCPEDVELGFNGPLSPCMLMPGAEWQSLVLPVRVEQ